MSDGGRLRRAAALIIGNELLTGKTEDVNLSVLARQLFSLGIQLERAVFCRDEVQVIHKDLEDVRHEVDVVVTSGGIGPTHDDVTMQAIAEALGRDLVHSPEIEALLRTHFGERLGQRHLRMALLPEGAELVMTQTGSWPLVRIENVFVLPGLPQIFQRKMTALAEVLGQDAPILSRSVATRCNEGELGDLLERLQRDYPEVMIGSYPRWQDEVKVLVTLDSRSAAAVDRAVADLLDHLPADKIVDTTPTEMS